MMIFTVLAMSCYLLAAVLISLRLFHPNRRIPRIFGLAAGVLGISAHGITLYDSLLTESAVSLGFFTAISLTACTISALLLISSINKPVENLAILIFPLTAIGVWLDFYYPQTHWLTSDAGWVLASHIISSMLAYALLTLASAQALLLALQDNQLRHHHPGGFMRSLPPLQTMEALLFEMIALGFILLSLALLSGFVYLEDMFAQQVAHKTILSVCAWVIFALLLWGRVQFGWRGSTAIRWTLVGFFILMLAYFGSKAILELILER